MDEELVYKTLDAPNHPKQFPRKIKGEKHNLTSHSLTHNALWPHAPAAGFELGGVRCCGATKSCCGDVDLELGQPSKAPGGGVQRQTLITAQAEGALHFAARGAPEEPIPMPVGLRGGVYVDGRM